MKYQILFTGKLNPGVTPEQAKTKLATLHKVPVSRIEKLFTGQPCVIVTLDDFTKASKYHAAYLSIGMQCLLQQQESDTQQATTPSQEEVSTSKPVSSPPIKPKEIVPPQPKASDWGFLKSQRWGILGGLGVLGSLGFGLTAYIFIASDFSNGGMFGGLTIFCILVSIVAFWIRHSIIKHGHDRILYPFGQHKLSLATIVVTILVLVIISTATLVGYGFYAIYTEERAIASRPTLAPRPTPMPTRSPEQQKPEPDAFGTTVTQKHDEFQKHTLETANKTIGISSTQVLKGLKEYFTNSLEDTTFDGLPIQMVTTEYSEVMVELTGKPEDLSSISIDTVLSESADEKTDIQCLMIISLILENIFPKSSTVFEWYEKNLKEGLKQKETMEKLERVTIEEGKEITLIVVRLAKGYLDNISVKAAPETIATATPAAADISLQQQQQIYQESVEILSKKTNVSELQQKVTALCEKYAISRDQLLDIKHAGDANQWQKQVAPVKPSAIITQATAPQTWPFTISSGELQCERESYGNTVYITLKTDKGVYALNAAAYKVYENRRWETAHLILKGRPTFQEAQDILAPYIQQAISLCPTPLPTPLPTAIHSGITQQQILRGLSDFTFDEGKPINGMRNLVGVSSDQESILQLIGEAEQVSQIGFFIMLPSDDTNIVNVNISRLKDILQKAIPEWKDCSQWAIQVIKNAIETGDNTEKQAKKGHKIITIQWDAVLQQALITIDL